jgi:hypothetical protein
MQADIKKGLDEPEKHNEVNINKQKDLKSKC